MKVLLLFTAVASASIAAGVRAQVTRAKPDSSCTNYPDGRVECKVFRRGPADSLKRSGYFYSMDSAMAKRAALGLELRTTGTRHDTLGVFVEAVTPKGPAESAGIFEGDRIAAINGVDLRTAAADTEDSYTNGLAAHRLTREVQKLSPGARVTLRVYSAGRFRDVQVTAGKASEVMRRRFSFGPGARMMEFGGPGMMRFGPDMMMLGPDMPMLKQKLEKLDPMIREKLKDLPRKIELRSAPRLRIMAPPNPPDGEVFTMEDVDADPFTTNYFNGDAFSFDDLPNFDYLLDLDYLQDMNYAPVDFDFEPITAEEIRELVAIAAQDARSALARLAAEQAA